MTISHPANVKNILASGIDSLVISLALDWKDDLFFSALDEAKEKAKQYAVDYQINITHFQGDKAFPFTIKPHGTKRFSWILSGSDFTFKIANSITPTSSPSVMIEIRSEALWRLGPGEAIKIALGLIEANGGHIIETKLSRVDLCLDFMMPENRWNQRLMKYAVTRATDHAPYYSHRKLTGLRIGKGIISARLYDKALEIEQRSKKDWMYDVWGLKEVPEEKKIIRIEFQLRREILKQIGLNAVDDLFQKIDQTWAYCTKKWLKFQDRQGLHHTQRTTFRWYEEIQDGFQGAQGAEPLVRIKAIREDKRKLLQLMNGCAASLHAIKLEEQRADLNEPADIKDCILSYIEELEENSQILPDIRAKVARKRPRYHREKPLAEEGQRQYQIRRFEK